MMPVSEDGGDSNPLAMSGENFASSLARWGYSVYVDVRARARMCASCQDGAFDGIRAKRHPSRGTLFFSLPDDEGVDTIWDTCWLRYTI